MRLSLFYILALLLIPFSTAVAGNAGSNSDPSDRVDPCKSGNCGLEYKQRGGGGGGKSRSVLKMSFGRSGGRGTGYGRRRSSRGKSFRRSSRGRKSGGYRRSSRRSFRMR